MKKIFLKVLLVCLLLNFGLTACGPRSSCVMQAVAGGSQFCEPEEAK